MTNAYPAIEADATDPRGRVGGCCGTAERRGVPLLFKE